MKEIKLPKEAFDEIKKACSPHIKDNCKYCGCKIDKDSFGLLSRKITCCKSLLCLMKGVDEQELNSPKETEASKN